NTLGGQVGSTDAFISKLQSSPALSADLQVTQTVSPTGTISGNVQYNVTVTNNGPDTAYSVLITDSLPKGLVATNCFGGSVGCQLSSDSAVSTIGSLASGGTATLNISASVNCATAVDGSTATNIVNVSSLTPDPSPGNNSASVSNTVSNAFPTSISPQSANIPSSGTNFSQVSVTAPPCQWQAVSNAPWIRVFFTSGNGNGFVSYSVDVNNGPQRTGTMTIAGRTFTVVQGIPPQYQGFHDGAGCGTISGWAWDANNPSFAINVDIFDGNFFIATAPANMYREDLLNVLGSPNHGFSFPTPANLKDGAVHSITVKISGTNIVLGGGPKGIRCSGGTNLQGSHDGAGCHTICGWAGHANDPGNVVNVDVYPDGFLIETIPATQYRQDLANIYGQPYHGFNFPTPASLRDGQRHIITVKFGGTNTNLTFNTPK